MPEPADDRPADHRSDDHRPAHQRHSVEPHVLFGTTSSRDRRTIAEVLRNETVGGALMLAATVVALIWANVSHDSYEAARSFHLGPLSLEHWAADGLLTIFFFVAGLELKRELTIGSLSKLSDALVPIVAAVCGMVVPTAIFLAINLAATDGEPRGWAIPMATDIAFALAILAVVGRNLPASLRAFLLTLAIVDDLGAIIVIATVFTESVSFAWLAGALACVILWWLLQRRHIDHWWIFIPLAVLAWFCTYQSGVHATVAGVAIGLATRSQRQEGSAPVEKWEHSWRPISSGVAVPLFALFAAGVAITPASLKAMVQEPLAIGIILGLVAGKTIGIFGGAYLTARFTRARLAPELRWVEVFSVAILGGVGFTVALLVGDLAFGVGSEQADHAKEAVLVGSVLAAIIAAISLIRRDSWRREEAANDG